MTDKSKNIINIVIKDYSLIEILFNDVNLSGYVYCYCRLNDINDGEMLKYLDERHLELFKEVTGMK